MVTNAERMRSGTELPARVMRSVGDWAGGDAKGSLGPSICHVAPFADKRGAL